ncbi:hypothetical protein KPH14_011700 [Odynerus spinipes]|uniref:Uncharacterized protein n=1 Tax=Odynerus spinipes TaxID=1348599 RepID=A0AAD9RWQ2_9HYME|nr:hypothetical protein KPH14_011700 [Odynerus spinipes]
MERTKVDLLSEGFHSSGGLGFPSNPITRAKCDLGSWPYSVHWLNHAGTPHVLSTMGVSYLLGKEPRDQPTLPWPFSRDPIAMAERTIECKCPMSRKDGRVGRDYLRMNQRLFQGAEV